MVTLLRSRLGTFWIQVCVVLAVLLGIVCADIAVAQSRIAENNRQAAARALHKAEAAYAVKVDAISRSLYLTVQPVQDALDKLDASQPTYIDGARDAVVNSRTSASVKKLIPQVTALKAPRTMVGHQTKLQAAVKGVHKYLAELEKAKKAKDAADMLDTPYSSHAFSLSEALDNWHGAVVAIDTATSRALAPTPRPVGEKRSKVRLAASKASWILAADHVCATSGQKLFRLKEPKSSSSLATFAKYEDSFGSISQGLSTSLRKIAVPTQDKRVLQRGVLRALGTVDQVAKSSHAAASAIRARNLSRLEAAYRDMNRALKGLKTLSAQMTRYGAEYCGEFFNPSTKRSSKNGGSGTLSA